MTVYAAMSKQIHVNFSVQGAIREDRQTGAFVSYCPVLDLYSAGRTRMDAKAALTAAVETYVRICYDRGILGRVLKQKGFEPLPHSKVPAATSPKDPIEFVSVTEHASEYDDIFDVDVPLHLLAEATKRECEYSRAGPS